MKTLAHLLALIGAVAFVVAGYTYFDFLRLLVSAFNGRIVESLLDSSTWGAAFFMRPVLHGALLGIEGLVATALLWAAIEAPFKGKVSRETLRFILMAGSILTSLLFGAYVYSVLWGDVTLWGVVIMPGHDPARLSFALAGSLAQVGAWYGVSQGIPLLFRPRVGVFWPLIELLSSLIPLAFVVGALMSYWFGDYPWTTYRLMALKIWSPIEIVDVIVIAVNLRLLTRGFLGGVSEETVIETTGKSS
ncbi:MAG: hypothetical protein AAB790_02980 [Patescibacteria group bacterium]